MKINGLDLAACGSDFIDAETGKIRGVRKMQPDLILEGCGFSDYFPYYHQFMRTTWAKVYTVDLFLKYSSERARGSYSPSGYGFDTLLGMENFRNSRKTGIFTSIFCVVTAANPRGISGLYQVIVPYMLRAFTVHSAKR